MARVSGPLLAVLMSLELLWAGTLAGPASALDEQSIPSLALGPNGSLNLLDDGRFELFSGSELVGPASHWTVHIGSGYLGAGAAEYRNSIAAPLREGGTSYRMLLWSKGVFTELAFSVDRTTAILTATAVNSGNATVLVAFRCALDIRVPELGIDGSGVITRETAIVPGPYTQLIGYRQGRTAFSCLMPQAPELLELISDAEYAVGSDWDFPFNPNLNLTAWTGALLYWPERALAPGDFYQVRVLLRAGPAEEVALPQNGASVRGLTVTPASDSEQRPRTVSVSIGNTGPAADMEMTMLFMLGGVPFSMKFVPVHVEWNQTMLQEHSWTPYTPGNYSVSAILPFFNDGNPTDNVMTRPAEVRLNPYRFVMRFTGDQMVFGNLSFPGAKVVARMYIYNTGFASDSIRIKMGGLPERWVALLSSNLVSLGVNQMGYINLTLRLSTNADYGRYAFSVLGTSLGSGETQTLLVMIDVGDPPPVAPDNHTPPVSPGISGPQNITPPTVLRPYRESTGDGRWFSSGERGGMAVLSVIGIAAAIGIMAVGLWQAAGMRTLTVMHKIIKRALYGLATGDEYRKTIFEAYRKMCAHLDRYGYTREEHVSPREFSRALKLALPLDTKSIRVLTKLFEEARYSDHRMGERSRQAAIESLKYVEQDLQKLTTFAEAPSAWERLKRRWGLENN